MNLRMVAMSAAIFSMIVYLSLTAAGWRKYSKFCGKKPFLIAGYLLMRLIRHSGPSPYERRLEYKYRLLGYNEMSSGRMNAHLALKCSLIFGSVIFAGIIGSITQPDAFFAGFAISLPFALSFAQDRRLDSAISRRKRRMGLEFPVLLNKIVLLTGAGMNFLPAISKTACEGSAGSYIYDELKKTLYDIDTGKSYQESFEGFSRRCGIMEINTFVSLVLQNMRKGNDSLVPVLRLLSDTCWEKRRNAARKIGEEMSTKLIFPTMMIFIATLILLMTPAFIQMSAV